MGKILVWLMTNGAALLGILQGIIKVLKELATLIVDLVGLFIPTDKLQVVVGKVRNVFNTIDKGIEVLKGYLVK